MGEYIKNTKRMGEEIKIGVCCGDKWETWFTKDMLILLKEKGFMDWYAGEFCGSTDTLDEFIDKYEQINTSFIKYSTITDIIEEYPEYEDILMEELNKKYIIKTLKEERLWKEGEADTFRYGDWKITLRKEEKIYMPFIFSIYGEKDNNNETWRRRYTSMEEAFLHVLNEFNENINMKNKYVTLSEYIK